MRPELTERVRDVILAIPPGSVLSYGEVAARAEVPSDPHRPPQRHQGRR